MKIVVVVVVVRSPLKSNVRYFENLKGKEILKKTNDEKKKKKKIKTYSTDRRKRNSSSIGVD